MRFAVFSGVKPRNERYGNRCYRTWYLRDFASEEPPADWAEWNEPDPYFSCKCRITSASGLSTQSEYFALKRRDPVLNGVCAT